MRAASGTAASPGGWLKRRSWTTCAGARDCWRLALVSFCCSTTVTANAADAADKKPGALGGAPLGTEGLLETAAGLLLVLAMIIALAWAARRYGRFPMAGKGLVNVLGGITLGSRERVVVVQVDDTRLVLGVAPGRIQTLYVLDRAADGGPPFSKALDAEMREPRR